MSSSTSNSDHSQPADDFKLEWHGDAVVIIPSGSIESMSWEAIEHAAQIVFAPLKKQQVPLAVFDLSQINYFGSVFLALLLRCHKLVKSRGGDMVLCGASKLAAELLHVTALDTLWAIYDNRAEALSALTT